MKHEVNSPCTVCGGQRSRLLHSVAYPDEGYAGPFDMRECEGCGLLFNSPRLIDAEIERLYDGAYSVFRERERDAVRRVAMLARQTIGVAQQFTDARELLEVGCAKGYLMALLQARGWSVRGVELASDAAAFTRQRFGLQVFDGTVESWVASAGFKPAPVVLSTDVIEHVTDPLAFLRAMHSAVAPEGWLVLGTPNAASDHRHAQGQHWLGFNPFHIYLYTRDTLGRLLQQVGFEVVQSYTYTNTDPPAPAPGDGMRHAMRTALRASGLLPVVRRARDGVLALADAPVTAQALLDESADDAAAGLNGYLASADARSERRTACRGDNLVVIARRVR